MSAQVLLDEFGKKIVNDVRASYLEKQAAKAAKLGKPFNPNSRLAASMSYEINQTDEGIEMVFKMADSYIYVDKGRAPGPVSKQGQESIARWIKTRGLTPSISNLKKRQIKSIKSRTVKKAVRQISQEKAIKSLVFVIARKLKAEGYDATHFYSVIEKDGRLEEIKTKVLDEIKKPFSVVFKVNDKDIN